MRRADRRNGGADSVRPGFKTKAKNLIHCAKVVTERFHGKVPETMDALTTHLPGSAANANAPGNAFEKPAIVVDTHVKRVSGRLHLTRHTDPEKIESDLQQLMPARQWTEGSQRLLLQAGYVCLARARNAGSARSDTDCHWKENRTMIAARRAMGKGRRVGQRRRDREIRSVNHRFLVAVRVPRSLAQWKIRSASGPATPCEAGRRCQFRPCRRRQPENRPDRSNPRR